MHAFQDGLLASSAKYAKCSQSPISYYVGFVVVASGSAMVVPFGKWILYRTGEREPAYAIHAS